MLCSLFVHLSFDLFLIHIYIFIRDFHYCIYTYTYTCVYIYIHVCIYIYIFVMLCSLLICTTKFLLVILFRFSFKGFLEFVHRRDVLAIHVWLSQKLGTNFVVLFYDGSRSRGPKKAVQFPDDKKGTETVTTHIGTSHFLV